MEERPVNIFIPGASKMLAAIAITNGDRDGAEKYLDKGIELASRETDKLALNLEKVRLILNDDRGSEARSIVEQVLSTENISPRIKQKAEELLGMMPS
jgi:uncharacterized protein HemY